MQKYRATPLTCGKSPTELYLGRRIRIRLDVIFPIVQPKRSHFAEGKVQIFSVGDRVTACILEHWEFGTVIRKLGSRSYIIKLNTGRKLKKHVDQLRATNVPEKRKVSFGPTETFRVPKWPTPQKERVAPNNPKPSNTAPGPANPVRPSQCNRCSPDFFTYKKNVDKGIFFTCLFFFLPLYFCVHYNCKYYNACYISA